MNSLTSPSTKHEKLGTLALTDKQHQVFAAWRVLIPVESSIRTSMNIIRTIIAVFAFLVSASATAQAVKSTLPGFQLPKAESEYDKTLLADISRVGWYHVHVQSEKGAPRFAYSLGFYANYGQPEVIVFGLPVKTAQALLDIVAVRFAGAKTPYENFKPYDDIAEGMRIAFVPVARHHYPAYLGYARWFYKSVQSDFPVIQMVWPDRQGRLPWEPGYDKSFARFQPLLDR